jgi:hypothetical protein
MPGKQGRDPRLFFKIKAGTTCLFYLEGGDYMAALSGLTVKVSLEGMDEVLAQIRTATEQVKDLRAQMYPLYGIRRRIWKAIKAAWRRVTVKTTPIE